MTIRFRRSPAADAVVVSDRLTSRPPESGADQAAAAPSVAGAQEGLELVSVGRLHEPVDAAADNRLEWLAHQRREAGVGIQDVAATREDNGAFLHLFDEVAVRLVGAVQRVDLAAAGAFDDQRVDLALPNRPQHLLGFGEARA